MKILIVAYSDSMGGAGIAVTRLACALKSFSECDLEMIVLDKKTNYDFIHKIHINKWTQKLKMWVANYILKGLVKKSGIFHSGNFFGSREVLKYINSSDAEIVNLHWINNEVLSIKQISKIQKKIVWTIHDTWLALGTQHCNYQASLSCLDGTKINNFVKNTKKKYLRDIDLIVPSHWLKDFMSNSDLCRNWLVKVIPNTLDTDRFQPLDKKLCRDILNLPYDKFIYGFGVYGSEPAYYKGLDLLSESLSFLTEDEISDSLFCSVGGEFKRFMNSNINTINLGKINDTRLLSVFYSAIDVFLVPSSIDTFNQMAAEAHCCGTPVVAFLNTGLSSIVEHGKTGLLLPTMSSEVFYGGILAIREAMDLGLVSIECRKRARDQWDYSVVAGSYIDFFRSQVK